MPRRRHCTRLQLQLHGGGVRSVDGGGSDCWVYGPNPARGLEAGKSELATKRVRRCVFE